MAEHQGLYVLDLFDVYSLYDAGYFMSDGDAIHPNQLGHKFASDALYSFIHANRITIIPDIKEETAFVLEEDINSATQYCNNLFSGEPSFGTEGCHEVISDLIIKKAVYKTENSKDYFFIDFSELVDFNKGANRPRRSNHD